MTTEPQNTIELMSTEGRQRIAARLRHVAQLVADGQVTPDCFGIEPEWHATPPNSAGVKGCSPTGRMFLNLAYWQTAVTELPE